MRWEIVVALHVTDEELYRRYREAMLPLLEAHGGGFRFDFRVAEVLRSDAPHPINRVFAIHFGSRARMDAIPRASGAGARYHVVADALRRTRRHVMKDRFERHRQPWTPSEIAKLHQLVAKGMSLKAISKSLTRSEESILNRAKLDKLTIAKKR